MCGSGVVVRQSAMLGHKALGFDIDPLAVLMSKVWTRRAVDRDIRQIAERAVQRAKSTNFTFHELPWIATCPETQVFIEFWFAEPQRSALANLVTALSSASGNLPSSTQNLLQLALSRIIVTKHAGASLAWDVSHSRPHRKKVTNDFDVYESFLRSVDRLTQILDAERPQKTGSVRQGDCRRLTPIKNTSVDAVITSPPYLNAIDYLRGHKLSLVWLGYTIPHLRNLRAGAVGTERARQPKRHATFQVADLERAVRDIKNLPVRQRSIVHKYAEDAESMLTEMCRVLAPGGLMVLVLGDSHLRGHPVRNSRVFAWLAQRGGFELLSERRRPLADNKRYLPIQTDSHTLSKRMKFEVVQAYKKVA